MCQSSDTTLLRRGIYERDTHIIAIFSYKTINNDCRIILNVTSIATASKGLFCCIFDNKALVIHHLKAYP